MHKKSKVISVAKSLLKKDKQEARKVDRQEKRTRKTTRKMIQERQDQHEERTTTGHDANKELMQKRIRAREKKTKEGR